MAKDYYALLGVGRGAGDKELKQAYRRLARRYHPDVNPGNKAAEAQFKEINEAYEVLSDPEKRQRYDQLGANWKYAEQFAGQGPIWEEGGFDLGDLGDTFSRLFGEQGGQVRRRRHGRDIELPVEVSLAEAQSGVSRVLQGPQGRIEVKVPPGVDNGSRVRIPGKGMPQVAGGPAGDLYLVITVRPHPLFERRGENLHTEVAAPLTVAILGGEVEVPTLKGKVALNVPAETQNGQTFRLVGLGMPRLADKAKGDLLVKVKVMLPTKLSTKEKELFQELQTLRK